MPPRRWRSWPATGSRTRKMPNICWTRFNRPRARIALGLELLGSASAAIDISDGLLADAGHIAAASGVKLVIDPALLPLSPALRTHPDAGTGDPALGPDRGR